MHPSLPPENLPFPDVFRKKGRVHLEQIGQVITASRLQFFKTDGHNFHISERNFCCSSVNLTMRENFPNTDKKKLRTWTLSRLCKSILPLT